MYSAVNIVVPYVTENECYIGAHGTNLAHGLFLSCLWAGNGFYIFEDCICKMRKNLWQESFAAHEVLKYLLSAIYKKSLMTPAR